MVSVSDEPTCAQGKAQYYALKKPHTPHEAFVKACISTIFQFLDLTHCTPLLFTQYQDLLPLPSPILFPSYHIYSSPIHIFTMIRQQHN